MLDLRKVSILFLTQQNMKAISTSGRKLYQTAFPLQSEGIRAASTSAVILSPWNSALYGRSPSDKADLTGPQ